MARHVPWMFLVLVACAASPTPATSPAPPKPVVPRLHHALERASVPGVDIPGLLARDKLTRPPEGDTCCGEGRVDLIRTRWAELDGVEPAELVLELQEYIGEGCAETHIHIYQVKDPANPVALGPKLSHGGYHIFPYLGVVDLDADGVDELMFVGPTNEYEPATFERHGVSGAKVTPHAPSLKEGVVYLPFDHDGDGRVEVVSLISKEPHNRQAPVTVKLFSGTDGSEHPIQDLKTWLPSLFTAAFTDSRLERRDLTLNLLLNLRTQHAFSTPHPEAVAEAALRNISEDEFPRELYIEALDARWSEKQARRAQAMLDLPEIGPYAARAILRAAPTPADRRAVLDATLARFDRALHAQDDIYFTLGFSPGELTRAERERMCARLTRAIIEQEGDPKNRGDIAWNMLSPPEGCDATVLVVLDRPRAVAPKTLRAAINAITKMNYETGKPYPQDFAALRALVLQVLADPKLAFVHQEIARNLSLFPNALGLTRDLLKRAKDDETRRSLLISLANLPDAGPPELFLEVLQDTMASNVRYKLHFLIMRTQDLAAVRQGLARVSTFKDYDAYQWWAVYRPKELRAETRALLSEDAGRRLGDTNDRVRQRACQILKTAPNPKVKARLEAAARADAVEYVREACQEALDALAGR